MSDPYVYAVFWAFRQIRILKLQELQDHTQEVCALRSETAGPKNGRDLSVKAFGLCSEGLGPAQHPPALGRWEGQAARRLCVSYCPEEVGA